MVSERQAPGKADVCLRFAPAPYSAGMAGPPRQRTLRRRVRNQTIVVVVSALVLFAVPLGVALDALLTSRALTGLQRDATRAAALVPDNVIQSDHPPAAPTGPRSVQIGIYDASGHLVSGQGPMVSALAAAAVDGHEHDGQDGSDRAVVLPVTSDGTVVGSVRAAQPTSTVRNRIWTAWALLTALAAAIVAVALLLARAGAKRIAGPFEHITRVARDLGDGRPIGEPAPSGITEADAAATALRGSAQQINDLLENERDFVRHASHQLRTPLSALLLNLQQTPPDIAAALERAEHLDSTITDLLALRRGSSDGRCNPSQVATLTARRWDTADRPVVLRLDDTPDVGMSAAGLRQCLDVLLDNAIRHGAGTITVTVEAYGETVAVEVADEGDGFSSTNRYGTGLTLAASLSQRAGGDLMIRDRGRHPGVALVLPAASKAPQP